MRICTLEIVGLASDPFSKAAAIGFDTATGVVTGYERISLLPFHCASIGLPPSWLEGSGRWNCTLGEVVTLVIDSRLSVHQGLVIDDFFDIIVPRIEMCRNAIFIVTL
jgi:hypothetical protein